MDRGASDNDGLEISDENRSHNEEDEVWFEYFDGAYNDSQNENNQEEEKQDVLHELLDEMDNFHNWDMIELAVLRYPERVKSYQIPYRYEYEYASVLVYVLATGAPPLSLVKAILRAHPSSILGSVRGNGDNWWDFAPLRQACSNLECKHSVLKYVLHATLSALRRHYYDVDPLDILEFLIEDKPRQIWEKEKISICSFGIVIREMCSIVNAYNEKYDLDENNEFQPSSTTDFLLRFATKKYFCLDMKKEGACAEFVELFMFVLKKESSNVSICRILRDEFYFHKILSNWWPPFWEQCEIIESLIFFQIKQRKEYGFPCPAKCFYNGSLPLHLAVANKWPLQLIQKLFKQEPKALQIQDLKSGLYPFQLAALDAAFSPLDWEKHKVFNEMKSSKTQKNLTASERNEILTDLALEQISKKMSYETHFGKELVEKQSLQSLTNCFYLLRCSPQLISKPRTSKNK